MEEKQAKIDELTAMIDRIEADTRKYASEKANTIGDVLKTIPRRKVTKEGNISMHDHLLAVKSDWEKKPVEMAEAVVNQLKSEKNKLNDELKEELKGGQDGG